MSWQGWFTLAIVVVMVVALARDLVAPSVAVLGTVVVCMVIGIVTPAQAFAGFSSPAVITVAALYVVARGVEKSGALQPLVGATLGAGKTLRGSLARLAFPVAAVSAFLNNTPIVAMLAPQVADWAERHRRAPSEFLIPLSYATMLGGIGTLIGTSTNLVVSGLLQASGQPALRLFEQTPMGLPVGIAGVVVLVVVGPWLLPKRRAPRSGLREDAREFVVTMEVKPRGTLDGTAVSAGRLRNLEGVFLAELHRGEDLIAPVAPDTVLRAGDLLTFVGRADLVVDLQSLPGLRSAEQKHFVEPGGGHQFFEVVVGPASPLVGRTLKETGFRAQYQAAVVAIHRAGQRLRAKLGGVELVVGDTLLLLADAGFAERWRGRDVFLMVSPLSGSLPAPGRKGWIAGLMVLGVVIAAATGLLPVLQGSLVAALALVLLGVLTPADARGAVDLDVMLVMAGSFGLAAAVDKSGLGGRAATIVLGISHGAGVTGAVVAVVVLTILLIEVVTHAAAAALMFPVAMSAAADSGGSPRLFAVALAVAASCSFLTPIGYQTNTMVYGPGGYRFSDYARVGAPLTIVVVGAIAAVVGLGWVR